MNLDEIKDLIELVAKENLAEFEYQTGDERVRIRRGNHSENHQPYVVVPQPGALPTAGEFLREPEPPVQDQLATEPPSGPELQEDEDLVMVTAPIVGTFYEAPSPGAQAFVEVGDKIGPGQVLCIIEAMKLMNEIEAEAGGVIVKRFVANAQPVEFGEALFAIRPNGSA